MRYPHGAIILIAMLLFPSTGPEATEFFRARGDHSLNSVFAIPAPPAPRLASGQSRLLIAATYANQHAGGSTDSENLQLDGERMELQLSWHQALRRCLHWGLELPLIAHSEGYFDRAIESWHELFGLPNANREETQPNLLSIVYQNDSAADLGMQSTASSIGDMHWQLQRPAGCAGTGTVLSRVALRAGLKLPSGDPDLLSGSGAADWYLDFTSDNLLSGDRPAARVSFGLLLPGDSDLFSNEKSSVAYGSALLGWRYSPKLELLAQLDWHTPLFDSDLRELGSFATQLAVGGRWHRASGATFDFAIQEDVSPDTAPDITLHIAYRPAY